MASLASASPELAAAQPSKPSQKNVQAASDLVKKAFARSQAGDHAAAIELYLQANALAPNTGLLTNIASEYQEDGALDEALSYFCMYLEKEPTGSNARYARTQAKIVQAKLSNQNVDNVDDDTVCAAPAKPAPAPKRAHSQPAEPPADPAAAAPPAHEVPTPATDGGPSRTLMYTGIVTGGVGVIATGIGVYFGLQAQSKSDTLDRYAKAVQDDKTKQTPWPSDTRTLQHDGKLDANLQIGFLVAGGALVIGGAILTWVGWPDDEHRGERNERAVHVTPTHNGLAVFGEF